MTENVETAPPRVENAPGLVWRKRKKGWVAEWHARTNLVKRGFTPKSARLWTGEEPTDADRAMISDECHRLQSEMRVWGRGGTFKVGTYDGTLRHLIACYLNDEDSPFQKLRYRSRRSYTHNLCRIDDAHGDMLLKDVKARTLLAWHKEWLGTGNHVAMAHSLIGTVRALCSFGATMLEDADCERLSVALHRMRFEMPKPRDESVTPEQVIAIRQAAHSIARPSIALAQAFQFEITLRQKDVIGEWVPISEPGTSDVTWSNQKWLRGLRWSEIDENLTLRHTTSKRLKDIEVNLRLAPMVMEELRLSCGLDPSEEINRADLPASGPIIVSDITGLPYIGNQFRLGWRAVAEMAGVPKHVFNMDSRAGAISEATDAGADLEDVRHAATHSTIQMTQKYSRRSTQKIAKVMKIRVESRNKKRTEEA